MQEPWGLVLRISGWRLELGYSVRGMINLQATLFYVLDEGSMEDINITFMLCLWIGQSFANLLFEDLDSHLLSLYHQATYSS